MTRLRSLLILQVSPCVLAFLGLLAVGPSRLEGQAVQLRFGYGVSALSTPTWTPVHGPSVGIELTALGVWGIGIEYRTASRYRGEVMGYCGFEFCFEGPFDEEVFLRSFGLNVNRLVLRQERLAFRVALSAGFFTQGRHMTELETGNEFDRDEVTDAGLGVRLEARSPVGFAGLSPLTWLDVHRVFSTGCPSDGTCHGSRNHLELGFGFTFGR